jgi:hypothetical protein
MNSDCHLSSFSPCIDTGNPDTLYNDPEDFSNPGNALWPAMGGLRSDMGAFGGPDRIINHPPFLVSTGIPDTSFKEDHGPITAEPDLRIIFSDPDLDALSFNTLSDNPDIQSNVNNNSLIINSSPNFYGSGSIVITACDGELSVNDTFVVNIWPVNDAPFRLISNLGSVEFC